MFEQLQAPVSNSIYLEIGIKIVRYQRRTFTAYMWYVICGENNTLKSTFKGGVDHIYGHGNAVIKLYVTSVHSIYG